MRGPAAREINAHRERARRQRDRDRKERRRIRNRDYARRRRAEMKALGFGAPREMKRYEHWRCPVCGMLRRIAAFNVGAQAVGGHRLERRFLECPGGAFRWTRGEGLTLNQLEVLRTYVEAALRHIDLAVNEIRFRVVHQVRPAIQHHLRPAVRAAVPVMHVLHPTIRDA